MEKNIVVLSRIFISYDSKAENQGKKILFNNGF